MVSDVSPTTTRRNLDQSEVPTERATLQITTSPPGIALRAEGASTRILALGVIGPAATTAVGHFAGLPVWAITIICVLQIVAAVVRRRC